MYNNRMHFGDVLVKQISGIAIGMSPAPTLANLFVAIYKDEHILPFIPTVLSTCVALSTMGLASGFMTQTLLLMRAIGRHFMTA